MGPFKCYVMQRGVCACHISRKKRCEGVLFNVISITKGWPLCTVICKNQQRRWFHL